MARLYSSQLIFNEEWSGSAGPYTVPAGYLWVIRDISLVNYSLAVDNVTIYLAAGPVIFANNDIAAGGWIHETGRWVVLAGQEVLLQSSQNTGLLVSGYALTTP